MNVDEFKAIKVKNKRGKPEEKLQEACVLWFYRQYPKRTIYSIPNGGSRDEREMVNLKKTGLLPGASDLVIPEAHHGYHCWFIEIKTPTGTQTPEQKEFEKQVTKVGNKYSIIRNVDQFINEVTAYLNETR